MLDDPEKAKAALARLEAIKAQRLAENKLAAFVAYPKQRELFAAGKTHRERLMMASNQSGKSIAAAYEVALHATGLYPDDWPGYRFDRAPRIWACGETSEVIRDTIQRLLLGDIGQHGTGFIPKAVLIEASPARGIADLVDTITIRHPKGVSSIALKSYSSGRERFVGSTIDFAWLDEEAPIEIYTEVLTRTNVVSGPIVTSFTPILGISQVVKRFLIEKSDDRALITMTIDDALHYTPEQREAIAASYPEHERAARTKGIPTMGSGAIFPIDLDKLVVEPFTCPGHWIKTGGIDFGFSHPSAFCELWWDRDQDVIYLARTLRVKEQTPLQHVDAVRGWGLRWQWPRDGRNATLAGAGEPLAAQYRDAGLDMWHEAVKFPDGSYSVEAGLMEMLDRMRGNRWKIFKGANEAWLEEARLYHRDAKGMVVKEGDDAVSSSRYAMMGIRNGKTAKPPPPFVMPRYTGGSWMST